MNSSSLLSERFFACARKGISLCEQFSTSEILHLAEHHNDDIRCALAEVLACDDAGGYAMKCLCKLAMDNDDIVRITAIDSLSSYICEESYLTFKTCLLDEDSLVRLYSYIGIAIVGKEIVPSQATELLESCLEKEQNRHARCGIYEGLYILGNDGALDLLLESFADEDYYVRCCVLRALADALNSQNKERIQCFVDSLNVDQPVAVLDALSQLRRMLKEYKFS